MKYVVIASDIKLEDTSNGNLDSEEQIKFYEFREKYLTKLNVSLMKHY